jgi:hypothetical protein
VPVRSSADGAGSGVVPHFSPLCATPGILARQARMSMGKFKGVPGFVRAATRTVQSVATARGLARFNGRLWASRALSRTDAVTSSGRTTEERRRGRAATSDKRRLSAVRRAMARVIANSMVGRNLESVALAVVLAVVSEVPVAWAGVAPAQRTHSNHCDVLAARAGRYPCDDRGVEDESALAPAGPAPTGSRRRRRASHRPTRLGMPNTELVPDVLQRRSDEFRRLDQSTRSIEANRRCSACERSS